MGMLLLSFNLTRPEQMTERNNATYTTSRSLTENKRTTMKLRHIEALISSHES